MVHDRNSQSDSCSVVSAVLLALMVIIFVGAAGTWFLIRASAQQRAVTVAQEEAVRARMLAEKARAAMEMQKAIRATADKDLEDSGVADVGQITIQLDEDGSVSLDGNAIAIDNLEAELRRMFDASSAQLPVVIRVSGQCPFEHVARTRTVCEEVGAGRLRLELLED